MTGYAANWPERPVLHAVRIAVAPVINGDLSDAAWQSAPEFTDFTQHDPDDGKPATMRTSLRIVYDDRAIYFGARMTDPQRPTSLLFRRDTFAQSDSLSIDIDSQHDRLTGNSFSVAPAGVQADAVLFNDIDDDDSWDGVWESSTKITADGWIAEVRIPFSQLRFPDRPEHVWGLNVTRRTVRNNETVRIVNTKKGEAGFVSHFADLVGLQGFHRGRPLELVPYGVIRSDVRTRTDRNDPLIERRGSRSNEGLDLKYALTSSLTLTATVNPDFGQVEVDPAEINLSEFETFYSERRPFFTEGLNLFRFSDSPAPNHFNFIFPPSLFYTRRIGRAPQGRPAADFVASPSETTILAAGKLTGKLPGGWSIGILDALTDREQSRFVIGNEFGRQTVEPMTNYFTSRGTKQIGDNARVGLILTSVRRRLPEALSTLRRSATAAGIDGFLKLGKDKSWILEGSAIGSHVSGSAESIDLTQRSPSRYYQRPDAGHFGYDPSRKSLSGWGGRAMISKPGGTWRPNFQVQAFSPGLETNDTGFLRRTDIISSHAVMQYVNPTLTRTVRHRQFLVGTWLNRNFAGDTLERAFFLSGFTLFQNYWRARASLRVRPGALSDRAARGGPLVRTPSERDFSVGLGSDNRKIVSCDLFGFSERSADGSNAMEIGGGIAWRPAPNLQLRLEPFLRRSHGFSQYVSSFDDAPATATYGRSYLFANLEQHSFDLGTRADWTLTPRLSFQLYLQPFISSGDYHDYHVLAAARTRTYTPFEAGRNDDFNFRSIRGSAVVRWEFRPGSAMYVAWNENRADTVPLGDFRFGRDLRAIPGSPSHDVFLVKVSYWLPM